MVSSPSCANYALRKTAHDNVGKYDTEVTSILKDGFYVDDLLESALNEVRAGKLLWETKAICNDGGFNLTQLGSTSREVIDTIPEKDRMKGIKTLHRYCQLKECLVCHGVFRMTSLISELF